MKSSQDPRLEIGQNQRLLINQAMKQSFDVLQMAVNELAEYLTIQIELNPIFEDPMNSLDVDPILSCDPQELDFERTGFEVLDFLDDNFSSAIFSETPQFENDQSTLRRNSLSLCQHLIAQIPCHFLDQKEQTLAALIIGSLDEKGFLLDSLDEIALFHSVTKEELIAILHKVQQMDPPGIGAKSLQESLLIQLKHLGKQDSMAYRIIDQHFEDLLFNRLPVIQKKLKISPSEVKNLIVNEIKLLSLTPATNYDAEPVIYTEPDIILHKIDDVWDIEINSTYLPRMAFSNHYLKILEDPSLPLQDRRSLRKLIASGKWLYRTVYKRHMTLLAIAKKIVAAQIPFLEGEISHPVPMRVKEIADELNLHESTISRAIGNKYIALDQGIFPLKMFFERSVVNSMGDHLHSGSGKEQLLKLIQEENKLSPLSDHMLCIEMQKRGFNFARRTIAKYRKLHHIPPASKRKHWA